MRRAKDEEASVPLAGVALGDPPLPFPPDVLALGLPLLLADAAASPLPPPQACNRKSDAAAMRRSRFFMIVLQKHGKQFHGTGMKKCIWGHCSQYFLLYVKRQAIALRYADSAQPSQAPALLSQSEDNTHSYVCSR
jgi:hypothetical protein